MSGGAGGRGRASLLTALVCLALTGAATSPTAGYAACLGEPDSRMTSGLNNAILALLGVVALVEAGFVALFFSFRRRARRLREHRALFRIIEGGAK